jgi:hypothetical protein
MREHPDVESGALRTDAYRQWDTVKVIMRAVSPPREIAAHGPAERRKHNMPSSWDASIKLLYAADTGTFFTIDDVANGDPFDLIANVEIGENLNQNVDKFDLRVSIMNLTQQKTVAIVDNSGALAPAKTPLLEQRRVNIAGGWNANATAGDVLQAVASYKVTAGINVALSTALSDKFVVS